VLIENQLEKTDQVHLGQILTYAAGLKAVTVVWIAKQFTEEHRAALDWLNEVTDERMNFFALEIELWKINDSPVAPKFNVVSKPNGWSKNISSGASGLSAGRLTEGKTLQLEYWNSFQKYLADHNSFLKPQQPRPQHWTYIAIGRRGFVLIAIASLKDSLSESFETNEIRAELNITIPHSEVFFALLKLQRETIEKEFGDKLVWHNPEDANYCKIYIRKSADLRDKSKWDEQHQWLMKNIEGLHTVFSQRIKQLEVDENNLSS
jgi:hypothetical protein